MNSIARKKESNSPKAKLSIITLKNAQSVSRIRNAGKNRNLNEWKIQDKNIPAAKYITCR